MYSEVRERVTACMRVFSRLSLEPLSQDHVSHGAWTNTLPTNRPFTPLAVCPTRFPSPALPRSSLSADCQEAGRQTGRGARLFFIVCKLQECVSVCHRGGANYYNFFSISIIKKSQVNQINNQFLKTLISIHEASIMSACYTKSR